MEEPVKLDVLAIGAHPDDVDFVCGGTILKLTSLGYTVGILDMAKGELGTRGDALIRADEAVCAAKMLRANIRDNLELPDGHIWLSEESRLMMVRKIRHYRPKIIFTHYWEDPHPDHAHTCQIVREAAHIAGLAKYDPGSGQERFRPHAIAHFLLPRTVTPTFLIDISDVIEEKFKAVNCFRSQLHDPNSTEPETNVSSVLFKHRLESRQAYYGSLIGVENAEGFVVKEALNIEDPVQLLTRKMHMYS